MEQMETALRRTSGSFDVSGVPFWGLLKAQASKASAAWARVRTLSR